MLAETMTGGGQPWTGRRVLILLCAFFAVIFAVDFGFMYVAIKTHPGEVEGSYAKGVAYNQTLARVAAQEKLGWQTSLTASRAQDGTTDLVFAVQDRAGAPVDRLQVMAVLDRPATEQDDLAVTFAPEGGGRYRARLNLPLAGNWNATITTAAPDGTPVTEERRLWLH